MIAVSREFFSHRFLVTIASLGLLLTTMGSRYSTSITTPLKANPSNDTMKLHAIHFHREQLGVGKQASGIVFCVRSRPSDPEGGTEVIVVSDKSLSKMGLNSLIDLPENPQRKEILLRTSGPQRFAAFTRFDIDGDGIDEVLLTGKGGAGGWSEVTVFKIKHQAVNVIYHGGSKYGLAILDIDDDGKYEIANAGIEWKIRKNIIKAKQYDIYRLTGKKFQKTSTMKAERLEQLFDERKERIAIPRQAIETGNGVALRIYKIKET